LETLLLRLERNEYDDPSIWWEQNVPCTLVGCFEGVGNKRLLGFDEMDMREWRVIAAYTLVKKMIEHENGIMVVGPLIAACEDPTNEILANELLEMASNQELGRGNSKALKQLIRIGTATIASDRSHIKNTTIGILEQIIEEDDNDLIYFVGPLVAASRNPYHGNIARDLLEMILDKKLGKPDKETADQIGDIFRRESPCQKHTELVGGFLRKLRMETGTEIDMRKKTPRQPVLRPLLR